MKFTNYILNGIFAIAIIVLFILHFTGTKGNCTSEDRNVCSDSIGSTLPIAYVNADSLLNNFNFYTRLIDELETKLSKKNGQLNQRYASFQKEVQEFQQKAQNNAFLSRERAEQEQARLQKKQSDLEQAAAQSQQEMALEQEIIQKRLSDTIAVAMEAFNRPQKYQMIFTRTGNSILYAGEAYDITNDVIEFLNKRYKDEEASE